MSLPDQSYTRNCLLSALSGEDFALLAPHLERRKLEQRDVLFESNVPIEHVYFPEGGVTSVVATQEGGEEVEVGLFGRDGMTGIPVILGAGTTPHRCMIQVNGADALRIPSAALLAAFDRSAGLRNVLLRFVQAFIVQTAQTAAANAHYALPERLARWLLMCHDRVDGDAIGLTHEFMSVMLAVRRSGVTVTLHMLEGAGAIRSSRGLVTIVDRAKLEEIAGDSYGVAEGEYCRLIGPFGKRAA